MLICVFLPRWIICQQISTFRFEIYLTLNDWLATNRPNPFILIIMNIIIFIKYKESGCRMKNNRRVNKDIFSDILSSAKFTHANEAAEEKRRKFKIFVWNIFWKSWSFVFLCNRTKIIFSQGQRITVSKVTLIMKV